MIIKYLKRQCYLPFFLLFEAFMCSVKCRDEAFPRLYRLILIKYLVTEGQIFGWLMLRIFLLITGSLFCCHSERRDDRLR